MKRPCGGYQCRQWLIEHGSDPDSPSDNMCMWCGMEGPFAWWANRQVRHDSDEEESDDSDE